ncbi:expressed unknown protein [Seminavis robusta]|uniref:Uncharacterized protein n=1 Tax=Seminavis robusta TaxID=568900 RepID=A0A9N8EN37_9STRA|nr:expressed unknown protein [Seminavis robusta]|eukprot:Sro1596_g284760.1 n/a (93) ;mRNA; f:6940-7218
MICEEQPFDGVPFLGADLTEEMEPEGTEGYLLPCAVEDLQWRDVCMGTDNDSDDDENTNGMPPRRKWAIGLDVDDEETLAEKDTMTESEDGK